MDGVWSGDDAPVEVKGPVSALPPYIRRGFIQKVYSLLCVQLMITGGIATWFYLNTTPLWAAQHKALFYVAGFGSIAIMLGVGCWCQKFARQYPTNYIYLFAITILQAIIVGFVCTLYTGESILVAVATTSLVFLGLTLFACCSTSDFTGMGPYLYAGLTALMAFSFVLSLWSFFGPIPGGFRLVMALGGVLLFSGFIVYDTQLIVGGRHKEHQFEVDDYVFAALNIYLDVINLFLNLLELLGERR
mmetsp:Transcript_116735/g.326554  ORF Transcript_116735/g.326554 Transcript_116735/m.326554 type:complete len:246 (-) Transcript_116735:323-1060(-)